MRRARGRPAVRDAEMMRGASLVNDPMGVAPGRPGVRERTGRIPRASTPGRRRDDRGAAAVELVLLAPMLALILSVMVAGSRIWLTRGDVQQIAQQASREATLQSSEQEAVSAARSRAVRGLAQATAACSDAVIEVDAAAFRTPPGTAGRVSVRIVCQVRISDLGLPGLPGAVSASGEGVSVLERHRGRNR